MVQSLTLTASLFALILLWPPDACAGYDPAKEEIYVQVIQTEAASEPLEGKIAVAEVLRNRGWSTRGFCGLRRPDLPRFLRRTGLARPDCIRALRSAKAGSQLVAGATHYDNVEQFGVPKWAPKMRYVGKVGRHTFWREEK